MPNNANDIQGRDIIRLAGNKFNTGNNYQVEAACCGSGLPAMTLEATGGVTHPDYYYIANDLALVFVKPASGGGDAASIPAAYSVCPTASMLSVGDEVMAMGLGATTPGGAGSPTWLQFGHHEIYAESEVSEMRRHARAPGRAED